MFSGIVEEKGIVQKVQKKENLFTLTIKAKKVGSGTKIGDSIAVKGVCLTVTNKSVGAVTFDLMKETLDATTLNYAHPGKSVNLERALRVNARLGGHFVSGHVDGVGTLQRIVQLPNYVEWQIALNRSLMKYLAPKCSVAIDGVSLTIGWVKQLVVHPNLTCFPDTFDLHFDLRLTGFSLNICDITVSMDSRYLSTNSCFVSFDSCHRIRRPSSL